MDLYVRHLFGTKYYGGNLFKNLVGIGDGCVENQDICVILEQYKSQDFYNLAFPTASDQFVVWEYVSH